jgi:hypothetical protein
LLVLRIATICKINDRYRVTEDPAAVRHLESRSHTVPTFTELQKRLKRSERTSVRLGSEELLVTDARGTMRPGEIVDQKLRAVQGIASSRATARAAARRRQN